MPWRDQRSSTERGYGYRWRKLRLQILARDAYRCRCEDCVSTGALKPAHHVDHRIGKAEWLRKHGNLDGVDDPSNLRAINAKCHERKTARDRGFEPRAFEPGADVRGLPTDPNHPWNKPGGGG